MLTFSTLEQRKLLLWVKSNIARLESIMSGGGGPDMNNYYTKTEVDTIVGNIETLLSEI